MVPTPPPEIEILGFHIDDNYCTPHVHYCRYIMLVKFIITFGGFTFLLQKKKFQYNYKDGNFVTMDRKFDGSFRKGLQAIERSF